MSPVVLLVRVSLWLVGRPLHLIVVGKPVVAGAKSAPHVAQNMVSTSSSAVLQFCPPAIVD